MKYECVGVYTCTHGVCTCMGERKTTKHMEYEGGVPEGGKHRGYNVRTVREEMCA